MDLNWTFIAPSKTAFVLTAAWSEFSFILTCQYLNYKYNFMKSKSEFIIHRLL
jgi:hypothetical protein